MADNFGYGIAFSGQAKDYSGLYMQNRASKGAKDALAKQRQDEIFKLTDFKVTGDMLPVYAREVAKNAADLLNQYTKWEREDPSTALSKLRAARTEFDLNVLPQYKSLSDMAKVYFDPKLQASATNLDVGELRRVFFGANTTLKDVEALHNPAMGIYAGQGGEFFADVVTRRDPMELLEKSFNVNKVYETERIGSVGNIVKEKKIETLDDTGIQKTADIIMADRETRKTIVHDAIRNGVVPPEGYGYVPQAEAEFDRLVVEDWVAKNRPRRELAANLAPYVQNSYGSGGDKPTGGTFTQNTTTSSSFSPIIETTLMKDGKVVLDPETKKPVSQYEYGPERYATRYYSGKTFTGNYKLTADLSMNKGTFVAASKEGGTGFKFEQSIPRDTEISGVTVAYMGKNGVPIDPMAPDNSAGAAEGSQAVATIKSIKANPAMSPFEKMRLLGENDVLPYPVAMAQAKALSGTGGAQRAGWIKFEGTTRNVIRDHVKGKEGVKHEELEASINDGFREAFSDLGIKYSPVSGDMLTAKGLVSSDKLTPGVAYSWYHPKINSYVFLMKDPASGSVKVFKFGKD